MTTQRRASTPGGSGLLEAATIGDVKRFLCRLIQRVDRGQIPVRKANCMGQLANVLISAIHNHELEERLCQLEADRDTCGPAQRTLTISVGGRQDTTAGTA